MPPKIYFRRIVNAVIAESGICRATVEQLVPAVFDVIRRELIEGHYHCVPIESFGTFAIVDIPERKYEYNYKGTREVRTLPPTKRMKFAPTRSMLREVKAGKFDPTRKSFICHPDDPPARWRTQLAYQPNRSGMHKGKTIVEKGTPMFRLSMEAEENDNED